MAGLTSGLDGEQNPFLRYRAQLGAHKQFVQRSGRLSDAQFIDIVSKLDGDVAAVWGRGFQASPLVDGSVLAKAAGLDVTLSIKVESYGVGGSHKARHLFGVALWQLAAEAAHEPSVGVLAESRLAIASCGNAALGASVIARALDVPLDVFVPTWADPAVVRQLDDFGATVHHCERRESEAGDPCYLRFREAVEAGAKAFSVQGTDTPTTFDGGTTIGLEIAEQSRGTAPVDALYVQVGGGALATAVSMGLPQARLYPVQAEGCAPLRRAWDRSQPFDRTTAAAKAAELMTPWENPTSLATGILDDVTYDWLPLLERTNETGGHPIVAPESNIERAYSLAHEHTDVNVCSTGTAGLAGLLTEPTPADDHVVVLFTGIDRP